MTPGDGRYAVDREVADPHERVQLSNSRAAWRTPCGVEGGAFRCSDADFGGEHDFAVEQRVPPGEDTSGWPSVAVNELDNGVFVDPLGAMERRGCRPGDGGSPV